MTYGLIAALAWGISTIAAAWAARRVGTYMALLVSQLLGAGFLGLLALMMRPSLAGLDGLTLPGLAGAGLLGLLGWLTYYKALEDGPVGVVSAIAATYGGVAAVLAVLVLGERLGLSGGAGVILAVGGVGLAAARSCGGLAAGGGGAFRDLAGAGVRGYLWRRQFPSRGILGSGRLAGGGACDLRVVGSCPRSGVAVPAGR